MEKNNISIDIPIVKEIYSRLDNQNCYYCCIPSNVTNSKYYEIINNKDSRISKIWSMCNILKRKIYTENILINRWKYLETKKDTRIADNYHKYRESQLDIKNKTTKLHFIIFFNSSDILLTHQNINTPLEVIILKELPSDIYIIDLFIYYKYVYDLEFIKLNGYSYNGQLYIGDIYTIYHFIKSLEKFIDDKLGKNIDCFEILKNVLVSQLKIKVEGGIIEKIYKHLLTTDILEAINMLNHNKSHIDVFIDLTFNNVTYHPLLHSILNVFITNEYLTPYTHKIYFTLAEIILSKQEKLDQDEQLAVVTYLKEANNYNNSHDRLIRLSKEYNIDLKEI